MDNRIKELRTQRGWSMRKLAELLNTSASTVNKLEKGETALNVHWMKRLSEVFQVPIDSLLPSPVRGSELRDDVSLFEINADNAQGIVLGQNQVAYEVNSEALNQIGILPGTLIVVDISEFTISSIQSEDLVISRLRRGSESILLLRQYIAPSLLITNSSEGNAAIINLRTDDVGITGIVVSSYHRHRARREPAVRR